MRLTKKKAALIKENDKIWSLLVRIRDNFTCQICGKYSNHTEAMHIFGRAWKNTRWNIQNGMTGCYYCHRFKLHGGKLSEEEKKQIFINFLGEDKYQNLYEESRKVVRFDIAFVRFWNDILRGQFLLATGMTYEEFLKERKNAIID